jgi:hypothetical protein
MVVDVVSVVFSLACMYVFDFFQYFAFVCCRDLLQCSQHDVARALEQLQSYEKTRYVIKCLAGTNIHQCGGLPRPLAFVSLSH